MKKYFSVFLCLFAFDVYAAVGNFEIKKIGISESSKTLFIEVSPSHTGSECSSRGMFRYDINKPESLYREIYSGLLAAKLAGRTVEIAFTEAATECLYSAPQIRSMNIN